MTSVSTDRRFGVNAGAAFKVPCRAASTANLTLSGEQTVDGVALVTNDRVLVKDQTTTTQNGIYIVDTGTWTRAPDADGTYDVVTGTTVRVNLGTTNAGTYWYCSTTGTIIMGTSANAWTITTPSNSITTPVSLANGGTAVNAASASDALSSLGVIQCTAVGGTANAITCTIGANTTAYRTGQIFILPVGTTNTGSVTLTPTPSGSSALAAKTIKKRSVGGRINLVANDLIGGNAVLLQYDGTDLILESQRGWAHGADVVCAATIDLTSTTGDLIDVTGSTGPVTAITLPEGESRLVRFTGTPTLTNGASLVLPGAANITVAAGDFALFRGYASGVVRCAFYQRAAVAPAGFTPSALTATLSGDVALNNTGTFFDGPSVAQGTTGTWFVSGTITLEDTAGAAQFYCKLYDGTTTIASGVVTAGAANQPAAICLSGFIASPAGNLRIAAKDISSTSGQIRFNESGLSKDATITAFRIA